MTPFEALAKQFSERRKHRRVEVPPGALLSFSPIVSPAELLDHNEGEGLVMDLSLEGCRATSEQKVYVEKPYSVIIQLPNYPHPITVESAIARWTRDRTFGIMFIGMQREQERHLHTFLESFCPRDN